MKYRDILKVLFSPESDDLLTEGVSYTEALCRFQNGSIVDEFLLFSINREQTHGIGPIAKITIDMETHCIINQSRCEEYTTFLFVPTCSPDEVSNALLDYESNYPMFRSVMKKASSDISALTSEDYRIIKQIKSDIDIFMPPEMKIEVKKFCPDMFDFIEMITK